MPRSVHCVSTNVVDMSKWFLNSFHPTIKRIKHSSCTLTKLYLGFPSSLQFKWLYRFAIIVIVIAVVVVVVVVVAVTIAVVVVVVVVAVVAAVIVTLASCNSIFIFAGAKESGFFSPE